MRLKRLHTIVENDDFDFTNELKRAKESYKPPQPRRQERERPPSFPFKIIRDFNMVDPNRDFGETSYGGLRVIGKVHGKNQFAYEGFNHSEAYHIALALNQRLIKLGLIDPSEGDWPGSDADVAKRAMPRPTMKDRLAELKRKQDQGKRASE